MFKKDEYNQEEYNDYYQQEVAGSELNGSGGGEEEKGGMGKLIALLVLMLLAVAGYFGYNMMNSQPEEIDTTLQVSMDNLPQSVQNNEEPAEPVEPTEAIEPTKTTEVVPVAESQTSDLEKELERAMGKTAETEESTIKEEPITVQEPTKPAKETEENTVQTAVTQEVQKAVASSAKMSPEEVASIVAAVMQQMNQSKNADTSSAEPIAAKKDVELMNDLSNTDVDSVSADLIKELENINLSEDTQIDTSSSKKQVDVYNKVNVQSVTGNDTLSQLSNEINNVISEGINENKAKTYTESLKSEVDVRQNEMRIIVVKKGDTLGKLAQRAYGNVMDYKRIYRANPELTRPDRIYIGQKLRIPN